MKRQNKPFVTNKVKSSDNFFDFSSLLIPYANKEEIDLFNKSINNTPLSSFIINSKYLSSNDLIDELPFIKKGIDELSFQVDSDKRIGKSLLNFIGAFYMMDISSILISYYLKDLIKKDALVLDMCSAPGGKAISLAINRDDTLIISNDISYKRELETIKNYSRLGLTNILSTSIDPLYLKDEEIYDAIILDAPCSGSGMIRKDKDVKNDFSLDKVDRLLPIQENLLNKADKLLKEGGILLYSTCSLSIDEDENQIKNFLKSHDYEIINLNIDDKTIINGIDDLGYHLVPGIYKGEGIYFIILTKKGKNNLDNIEIKYEKETIKYKVIKFKNNFYAVSKLYKSISYLNFISPGIKIYNDDEYKKCDYDYYACKIIDELPYIELSKKEAIDYISGLEINTIKEDNKLVILTYKNIPFSFAKIQNRKIKNYLPKYLKTNLIF